MIYDATRISALGAPTEERVYTVEVTVVARVGVSASSKQEAIEIAKDLFGGDKKSAKRARRRKQATTGDGIPFTTRVL